MREIFLLFFIQLATVHCSCPDGWDLVVDGQCRGLVVSSIVGSQAKDTAISKCTEFQAMPVIIHNEEEQAYWTARKNERNNYLVLGLVCNSSSKNWQWADGSSLDYKPTQVNSDINKACSDAWSWYIYDSTGFWNFYDSGVTATFSIYCTEQLQLPVPSGDGCDSFEDDSDDGVCYQIGEAASIWQEAQIICRSFGADVASIHNEKENSFIRRLAVSKGAINGMYLGATISGKGNEFAWIDGSQWDYDNFYTGFPMKGLGDCLLIDTEGTTGQWANVDCSTKLAVACQRERNYSPPTTCPAGPWIEGQIIYSPGFPFNASIPCDYLLTVDAGKRVEVEILMLEANSCCDSLTILENYFGGNVIANLTGEVHDTKYTTATSNFMRVSWQPNGGVGVRGMMMTFRGV